LATLEGGRGAICVASGHAAQLLAFFSFMEPGDQFIASNKLYGGTITQFGRSFKKFGWDAIFVDPDDPENFRRALTPKCKAIFVETLSNPTAVVADLAAIAAIAHAAGLLFIVDNTMASPYLCRPFEWGADLVIHSTTKFLSGHGNALGGVVIDSGKFDWAQNDKFKSLTAPEPAYHGLRFHETFGDLALTVHGHAVGLRDLGATLAPLNAFLTITGIETLALRMARHVENAQAVAEHLEQHPAVSWVAYPGLDSSPYRALARKYLPKGAGSVFTFGLKGGYDAGVTLVESVELFSHLANVGDTRSLILHPGSTTHRQLGAEQQLAAGAGPDVVRVSIGIESIADIIADLDAGLAEATRR
jgi:O-acetylhomoserine (thiol)-lyase